MSQLSRFAKAHSELILLLFDCPKRTEETCCQKKQVVRDHFSRTTSWRPLTLLSFSQVNNNC